MFKIITIFQIVRFIIKFNKYPQSSITDAVDKLQLSFEEEVQCPEIFSGDIISDRKSHFQPHLAAVRSTAEVK